jgi:GT2 family glycosyltransferase
MILRRGKKLTGQVRARRGDTEQIDENLFIGMLGVNCLKYTRFCLSSIQTACKSVGVVYIDNGSTEENCAELRTWKKANPDIDEFNIGFNGYNAGVAVGWNQLAKMAIEWGADKILICNNDIVFGPHTIDGLVTAYNQLRKHDPRTVMVTATNHTKNPNNLAGIPQQWNNHEHPDFSCFMITAETLDRVGEFNEDYDPAFFEDNDFHWRVLLSGYKAWGSDWAPYSHVASRTRFENPDIVPHLRFRENKIKFYQNLVTVTVNQKVADERYEAWLRDHPGDEHPGWKLVNEHAREVGLIDDELVKRVKGLNIGNVMNYDS